MNLFTNNGPLGRRIARVTNKDIGCGYTNHGDGPHLTFSVTGQDGKRYIIDLSARDVAEIAVKRKLYRDNFERT